MRPLPAVTVQQMIAAQKRTELVCGFYGYDHPRCKRALKKDELLYIAFMNQFYSRDTNKKNADSS